MKRLPLLVLLVFSTLSVCLVAVANVSAQTDQTSSLDENSASISIVESLPVTASIDVNINGEIYKIAIPATVIIDAKKSLAEALLHVQNADQVGDLSWKITGITEYEDAFDLSQFTTVEPTSPDNKLVVVTSELTNLGAEPFTFYIGVSDLYAYDNVGNLFDPSDYECDDINPGASLGCTIVFDVPKTVLILGLDMKVQDHKRLPFTGQ